MEVDAVDKALGMATLAVAGLVVARWVRVRDREPEIEIRDDIGDEISDHIGDDIVVSERKYSCIGTGRGNIHGNCAESWWDHWWNDRPYCNTVEFWCELAGGKFKLARE